MTSMQPIVREVLHGHIFCGLGAGAKGFNLGKARVGNMIAKPRCIGGIDVMPAAIRDFNKLAGAVGTVMDLFSRQQYVAFHGKEPPINWREATPDDIRRAMGNEKPHIWFLSAPCKGFSGLLPKNKSLSAKYQALNELTLRGIWLALEAYRDDPVELLVFENVPLIQSRGRHLLDQIVELLRAYGYAVAETTHDCGELGNLAQSRKRFLLVARHTAKVPPFLYEPEKKSLRAVGDILTRMPLPGDLAAGPMHRIPELQWKTWVRLAFVEAGKDWRSLNRLVVENGHLRDYLIVPEYRGGYMGVHDWADTMGTVAGRSTPTNGAFSVADPRSSFTGEYSQYGILPFDQPSGAVSAQSAPGGGKYSVADPRMDGVRHNNVFRIVPFTSPAGTVTAGGHPTAGGQAVADPRPAWERRYNNMAVMDWEKHSNTVIAGGKGVQGGWMSVADPRPNMNRQRGDHYLTGGHYGVTSWGEPCGAVSASACQDNGRWSVADPRLPDANQNMVAIIRALDGTWHRPFTTLELAALQSIIEPEEYLELDGTSDSEWRERIGNAVPPAAAEAIASVMGTTLLLAWSGETFVLGQTPIWVRPVAVALAVDTGVQP